MRFIAAIVFFVIAVVGVGLGVAQRTVWAPPDRVTADLSLDSPVSVTVVDGSALNAYEGRQTVTIEGGVVAPSVPEPEPSEVPAVGETPAASPDPDAATETEAITAAYGRTADVMAWVGAASYNRVTWDAENGTFVTETVVGTESTVPNPYGGDLWYGDFEGEGELGLTINVPDDISLLVVSDGTLPAPQQLSVTWPLDNSTPFSTMLILGGVGSLVVGLLFLLWALLHMRRQRGPRRKTPKMPKVPKPSRYRPTSSRALLGRPKGRRAAQRVALVPGLLIGSVLLAACTTGGAGVVATPTPEATEVAETPAVAVTENQLERIVSRVALTIQQADDELDDELAATRLAGPALELREASYTIRDDEDDFAIVPTIPAGDVQLTLPQRLPDEGDTWPRSVLAIVREPATVNDEGEEQQTPPLALLLVQDDPRSQYKVHYAITVTLPEGAERPEVAPAELGAPLLPRDTPLLAVSPADVAAGYADVLLTGEESESFPLFQAEGDTLVEQIGAAAKAERKADLPDTAAIGFSNTVGEAEIFSFVTNDGGALVMLYLTESESVKPTQAGAAVNAPAAVAALAGRSQSTRGIVATYGIQVLFSVPPVGSEEQVVLLGYTQGLIAAREIR
ncbi:hypothetical protein [Microcella humidisoli]|uniref:DUF8094 domain-containing protein n=1 Tax=Microcella humidisoli TaxID=2963406 RepID=A0ABY5FU45_9MICO|nr:hypothetical protein [Microcella humidisoli]UTT61825.1 hypothetical protein NNL39_09055 [Microcella humidisoli]